jgi:TonB family protein
MSIAQAGTNTTPAVDDPRWRRPSAELMYIPPLPDTADYPADARRAHHEGVALLRLVLDANGSILSCQVIKSAGLPSLDDASCRLWREKGHFRVKSPQVAYAPVRWLLAD